MMKFVHISLLWQTITVAREKKGYCLFKSVSASVIGCKWRSCLGCQALRWPSLFSVTLWVLEPSSCHVYALIQADIVTVFCTCIKLQPLKLRCWNPHSRWSAVRSQTFPNKHVCGCCTYFPSSGPQRVNASCLELFLWIIFKTWLLSKCSVFFSKNTLLL